MYKGIPELFDYAIRLLKLKPVRGSQDIVAFHLLGDLVNAADHALIHYFTLTLNEHFLQRSHYGSPYVKWASVTNDDFKGVVSAIQALIPIMETLYSDPILPYSWGDGVMIAYQWLHRVRDDYDCCVIKPDNCLTLSEINLHDWIDPESGWFRSCKFFNIKEPPVVSRTDMDIGDRSVLAEPQTTGMVRVNQMRLSLDSLADWLRRNCTIEDVTELHQ